MAKKSKMKINAIRAALQALEDQGRLAPAEVVATAADPASPLHDQFEWDNSAAAIRYRLIQAESLIRRIRIEVRHHRVRFSIPAYVRDSTPTAPGMVSLTATDFDRADCEATVAAELARLRGNILRSRGVVTLLDQRFPNWDLLEFFEQELAAMVAPTKRPPGALAVGAGTTPPPPS